jgi:hypothetical protein
MGCLAVRKLFSLHVILRRCTDHKLDICALASRSAQVQVMNHAVILKQCRGQCEMAGPEIPRYELNHIYTTTFMSKVVLSTQRIHIASLHLRIAIPLLINNPLGHVLLPQATQSNPLYPNAHHNSNQHQQHPHRLYPSCSSDPLAKHQISSMSSSSFFPSPFNRSILMPSSRRERFPLG